MILGCWKASFGMKKETSGLATRFCEQFSCVKLLESFRRHLNNLGELGIDVPYCVPRFDDASKEC